MSTKIYYAWRVKIEKLNDFIDFVRPQVYARAEKILKGIMGEATDEGIANCKKKHPWYSENRLRLEMALEFCGKVSKQDKRMPAIDVDFGLNVWLFGIYAYIVPIGEQVDNITVPYYAEDYSYWDNTDRPEDLTDLQWETRARTWEEINLGTGISSHNARRLYHSIIDLSARYGDIDFEIEMEDRLVRAKKVEGG